VPAQNQNNQQHLMQQQQDGSGQLMQMPTQGSQNFQLQPGQQTPQIFSSQITPQQNSQYAPNPQQPQNQIQAQGLQQVPQQPLFQQQSGQQNGIISPQQQLPQQHVLMQHQMMQPQQQFQHQIQQPITILQTPILYSNALSPASKSPQKAIKKGRFRVVKGATAEAKTASPGSNDTQAVTSSNDAQPDPDKVPQPVSTVKKGRFVVKKNTIPVTNASPASEGVTKAGKKLSPQTTDTSKVAKKMANEKESTHMEIAAPIEKAKAAGPAAKENGNQGVNGPIIPPVAPKSAQANNPCTKRRADSL